MALVLFTKIQIRLIVLFVINLLTQLNGYGYYDALCQLANLSGSLSRFEKQPDKKQFWLPNLTKEERELIGLYPTKRIKLYYAIQENKPDDRKYDIIFGKEGEDNSFLLYTKNQFISTQTSLA